MRIFLRYKTTERYVVGRYIFLIILIKIHWKVKLGKKRRNNKILYNFLCFVGIIDSFLTMYYRNE